MKNMIPTGDSIIKSPMGAFKPKLVAETPSTEVIGLLEAILADAKIGIISCVGLVTVSPSGHVGTSFATNGGPHAHSLVAGSVYLTERAKKNAGVL